MEECECRTEFSATHPVPKNVEFPLHRLQILDFGSVKFGKKSTKLFDILNTSNKTIQYEIKRDPITNPIYKAFEYTTNKTTINPGNKFKIKVTYMPKIPCEVSIDYLQIYDTDSNIYILQLKGESKGFNLHVSATRLYFHRAPNSQKLKHVIELQNRSDMETYYQLDYDENMHFLLEKDPIGKIAANGHEFVSFKFKTLPLGIYYNCLYCLSSYYEPLLIELIGIVSKNPSFSYDDYNLLMFPLNIKEYKGFSGYLYDSIKLSNILPPFSINKTFYDFGNAMEQCNSYRSNRFTTALTNNLESDIQVTWICESESFTVTPDYINMHSLEHAIFEIMFVANEPEQFHSANLRAIIEWVDLRDSNDDDDLISINLPLLANIRVLGNTFPANKVWIPQIDVIPPVITLPITIPNSTTYTTFLMVNKGYLPSSFKFMPPSKTNFTLKPMIGIIREFQIVIVQLNTHSTDKNQYVECWTIECNNSKEHNIPIYLKGYAEYPTINVGNSNDVVFGTIQYGCEEILEVQMKNTSGHLVEYNFCTNEHKYVTIDHQQSTIAANEIITLLFYFESSPKASVLSKLRCELRPIFQMKSIRGRQINTFVTIYADLAYSELCATPKEWICNEFLYEDRRVIKFLLYNFGESPIYFTLRTDDHSCIDIMPTEGNLSQKKGIEITVHLYGKLLGVQESIIYYQLRKNESSAQIINDRKYNIFKIRYNCVLPFIQIEDILYYNFGELFPKFTLWEMLNINGINRVLKDLAPYTSQTITMSMPDSEICNDSFTIKLQLLNTSNFNTKVTVKRKKICDCKIVEIAQGLSFRTAVYDCPHRELVALNLSNDTFETNTAEDLTITLNYKIVGEHTLCHTLWLSFGRTLELYTTLSVLADPTNIASVYDRNFSLNFAKCFIGLKESYYKAFMLYNNTKTKLKYYVDLRNVEILNVHNNFDIIKCMNEEGELEPYTVGHILFKFTPLEAKVYEINIPLALGEKIANIRLSGEGLAEYIPNIPLEILPCKKRIVFNENVMIHISDEDIHIDDMLTHSTVRKIVFLKNLSKENILGYSFKPTRVDGFVSAKTLSPKGTLKPKEIKTLLIQVRCFDKPCKLRVHMVCKLLDHTLYIKRKKSEAEYYMKQYELAGQFSITENGIEYPVNDVQLAPKPKFFYKVITINVNVVSDLNKDMLLDTNTIIQQMPHDTLMLNSKYVSKINEFPCYKFNIHNKVLQRNGSNEESECECNENVKTNDYFSIFRDVLDYCMSDAIHCKEFTNLVNLTRETPIPYYYQIVAEGRGFQKKLNQEKLRKKHTITIPTKQMANILRQLITDSFYQIFSLGSQGTKERTSENQHYEVSIPKCIHKINK